MGWTSTILYPWALWTRWSVKRWSSQALSRQENIFQSLLEQGRKTAFGKDHEFEDINSYEEYREKVPIRDYEELKPYIERITAGESDVLWPGRPRYFAKTAGTTSGAKLIPITKDSLPNHFGTARNALFNYYGSTGRGSFLDGKMIFLSGSPEMDEIGGIPTGRLSGISNHLIPNWLKRHQLPSYETNCIEDWEEKLDHIIEETLDQDLRLISGIPPWVQMYFEQILERTGKDRILDIFPNFSVFVFGGVNYEPYRSVMEELIGGSVQSIETYPASEGFFAFQDRPDDEGLLLNVDSGIFYEFIPVEEAFDDHPTRLTLEDIETGRDYALIINSNAGLWGYNLGDTVRFVETDPYRIIVSGRVQHFISAFGEHVIGKEVEQAIQTAAESVGIDVVEFAVAPRVKPPGDEAPYHEWFIEFGEQVPADLREFALEIDRALCEQNAYYKDLIDGSILQPLKIRPIRQNGFREYMKDRGALGGQNKLPRLANDRRYADELMRYCIPHYQPEQQ